MQTDSTADVVVRHARTSFRAPPWFSPGVLILAPVGMSFLAWSALVGSQQLGQPAMSEALSGFSAPAPASVRGIALLLLWYCAIVMVSTVGFWLGTHRSRAATGSERTNTAWFERRYFFLLLAAGAVGVGYAFLKVGGISAIVDSLSSQTANDFSNALSGFAGLQTLRYATILAAPLSVYLWRKRVVGWPYMVGAVLLLVANAMISSRLSLLMACAVYLTAWVRSREPRQTAGGSRSRTSVTVALIALSGFAVLTALNYVRNANYYREAGVSNPVAMNFYQTGAYLAVPAQVSLGVSDAVARGAWEKQGDTVASLDAIKPTFLQFNKVAKDDSWKQASVYGYSVTFAGNFFTNSVFADTYSVYGTWGWFYTILAYGFAGYAFARIFSFSPVVAASAGVVAYCFLEVWRVQILTYGIVIFLLLLTAGSAVLASRVRPPRDAKGDA
ncbi:oligosaccharide repeat unit polymerase [Mycobacterium hodleri]|uniref:Oligosaccharide repeat unit polymerase n=1 Tax=Mycolicibacterium hodleri TaxID=49897 RepID=A0A544VZC4_9MYCO|nr:O-antigen polymerase [Mycolicibacterium hodleri]TQR85339.1 oligosaccharide repeat unit polymerase [Mycolicibacterium hodleri]